MAEAPDAQFVAEDAVVVYHKKFSVTFYDDDVYHYDNNEDDILRVSCCFPIMWFLRILSLKFIPRGIKSDQSISTFLQENWFHDCDNEHAKITAFFQVMRVTKMGDEERQWLLITRRREQKQFADSSLSRFSFFQPFLNSQHSCLNFPQDELSKAHASTENRQVISGGRITVNIK